jgi:broad specificity phosphatase PhoE
MHVMKITLVRHGESEANVAGIINDDPSRKVNLTAAGRGQALALGDKLKGAPFVQAYTSEFARAHQTAIMLLGDRCLYLETDARLNERKSGMDGRPVDEFNGLVRPDPVNTRPPAGESFLEQMERVKAALDDMAARHADAEVLAISHENPILAACALAGMPMAEAACASIPNCGCVVIEWGGSGGRVVDFPR